jgi:hypothetical protein
VAIFFVCRCGQDLRADESRAGGRTECPACGGSVAVPSLLVANRSLGIETFPSFELPAPARPTPPTPPRSGGRPLAPELLPARQGGRPESAEDDSRSAYPLAPQPPDWLKSRQETERALVREAIARAHAACAKRPARAPRWRRERHWYQCLQYPLRAWLVLLMLAVNWATWAVVFLSLLPDHWGPAEAAWRLPLLAYGLMLLGYTCAFCRCTLTSGIRGEAGFIRWPGGHVLRTIPSGLLCLACFLAGPVVPAAVALWFWLNSGDLLFVDRLILVELVVAAAGYWFLVFLAAHDEGGLRGVSPAAVVRLVRREGWRVPVAAAGAGLVGLAHGRLALLAVDAFQRGSGGWTGLAACAAAALFWITFLCRWHGLSWYHTRRQARGQRPAPASVT